MEGNKIQIKIPFTIKILLKIQIKMKQNNPFWEALKFLLILLLILLIAAPQLVLSVLLLILMGALLEIIRALTLKWQIKV